MKKINAIIILLALLLGLSSSCQTKHGCPAYGSAHKAHHRAI